MIDWIVAIVSLFALVFTLLWFFAPGFRAQVERPKFRMLENEKKFNKRAT
jgi:hypothetical protein